MHLDVLSRKSPAYPPTGFATRACPHLTFERDGADRKRVVVGGRGILEADSSAHLDIEFTRRRRPLPDGWRLVRTAQPRGAIAVYLCEAGSDDGLLACELIDAPEPGAEFPAWRIHGVIDARMIGLPTWVMG